MPEMTAEQQKELQEKVKNMSPEELKEFQKQQCIFCQIISGKVPSQKIYSDDKCFAVLDINPANQGHILLLPQEHYAIMPQIPEEEISHLFTVAKYLSQAQLKAFKAQGTTVFVANGLAAGQRAQHFMIHIIPRFENDGLKILDIPQKQASETDLQKLREVLIPKINQVFGLKKETVIEKKKPVEEKPVEEEKQEEEVPEETPKETREGKKPSVSQKPEVSEKIKPKKEKKPKKKSSNKSEKSLEKSKTSQKETKKPKKEKKEEASLDDIAELFG